MLNETTSEKILNSEIWKTWSAEKIVRLQVENAFQLVPDTIFNESLKIVFDLDKLPDNNTSVLLQYRSKFPKPLTLKEVLSWLPKSFYMTRIK